MELELDVIAVILVFIGFCIGSALLIRKANNEMKSQEQQKRNFSNDVLNKKNSK